MDTISEGYKAFNGHVFAAEEAAAYNRACEETERQIMLAGRNPSPMAQDAIDFCRDRQAQTFKIIIGEL